MGLYIGVAKADRYPVSGLEQDKYSGGREFIGALGKCHQLGEEWEMIRPDDLESAKLAASRMECNAELFGSMIESLEHHPDHYLHVFY